MWKIEFTLQRTGFDLIEFLGSIMWHFAFGQCIKMHHDVDSNKMVNCRSCQNKVYANCKKPAELSNIWNCSTTRKFQSLILSNFENFSVLRLVCVVYLIHRIYVEWSEYINLLSSCYLSNICLYLYILGMKLTIYWYLVYLNKRGMRQF